MINGNKWYDSDENCSSVKISINIKLQANAYIVIQAIQYVSDVLLILQGINKLYGDLVSDTYV